METCKARKTGIQCLISFELMANDFALSSHISMISHCSPLEADADRGFGRKMDKSDGFWEELAGLCESMGKTYSATTGSKIDFSSSWRLFITSELL